MTHSCPTCGHAITDPETIRLDEDRNLVVIDGDARRLTGQQMKLFVALMKSYPNVARRWYLLDTMYTIEADQPDDKIIDIMVCNIRKRLKGTRIEIRAIWQVGFELIIH